MFKTIYLRVSAILPLNAAVVEFWFGTLDNCRPPGFAAGTDVRRLVKDAALQFADDAHFLVAVVEAKDDGDRGELLEEDEMDYQASLCQVNNPR